MLTVPIILQFIPNFSPSIPSSSSKSVGSNALSPLTCQRSLESSIVVCSDLIGDVVAPVVIVVAGVVWPSHQGAVENLRVGPGGGFLVPVTLGREVGTGPGGGGGQRYGGVKGRTGTGWTVLRWSGA